MKNTPSKSYTRLTEKRLKKSLKLDEETLHDEACDAALTQHLDQELAKKDS